MNVVYDVEMDFDIVEDEIVIHLVIILLIPDVTMCAGVLNRYISIQTVFDRNDPCL